VVLILYSDRHTVAAGVRDHLLDIFRADPRRVVADVDDVVLPVQLYLGYVRLILQGPLDGTGTAQFVNATELERAAAHGNMLVIGCPRSRGVVIGHGGYVLLSMLHILSLPTAKVGATVAA
jgi:hypothetical protein